MLYTSKYGTIDCNLSDDAEAEMASQAAQSSSTQWVWDNEQRMHKFFDTSLETYVYHDTALGIYKYWHDGRWIQKQ